MTSIRRKRVNAAGLCTQKEFSIESKLNGFFFCFFSVTFALRIFHMGGEVK